jgi:hypothetical protein
MLSPHDDGFPSSKKQQQQVSRREENEMIHTDTANRHALDELHV